MPLTCIGFKTYLCKYAHLIPILTPFTLILYHCPVLRANVLLVFSLK